MSRKDIRSSTINTSSNDDLPLSRSVNGSQIGTAGTDPVAESPVELESSASRTIQQSPASQTAPSNFSLSPSSAPPMSAISLPGRAMSMISTTSSRDHLTGAPAHLFENPQGAGLRIAVTEALNVLSRGGSVYRVMVTGQVMLLARDVNSSSVRLRMSNAQQLEKIAPNDLYLQPAADGDYTLDVAAAEAASQSGNPLTIFRYQFEVTSDNLLEYAPITVKPQWKCETNRTLLVVEYHANPTSILARPAADRADLSPFDSDADITSLRDLAIAVPLTSTGVSELRLRWDS